MLTVDSELSFHGVGTHFLSAQFLCIIVNIIKIILSHTLSRKRRRESNEEEGKVGGEGGGGLIKLKAKALREKSMVVLLLQLPDGHPPEH